jgi:hypothetical protein
VLRISVVEGKYGQTTLELEGQLIGPWIVELERLCTPLVRRGTPLNLDLRGVSFVGRDGVQLLCNLREQRVTIGDCSTFVLEQLKAGGVHGA